jgi:hypothetical protein
MPDRSERFSSHETLSCPMLSSAASRSCVNSPAMISAARYSIFARRVAGKRSIMVLSDAVSSIIMH